MLEINIKNQLKASKKQSLLGCNFMPAKQGEKFEKLEKFLFSKLQSIAKTNKFDINKTYCFFKHFYSPTSGSANQIRIYDCESDQLLFTITPKTHNGYSMAESSTEGFVSVSRRWVVVKNYFLNN